MPRDMTKWREAVRRSNNKPASGIPAGGVGWGGEKAGPGNGAERARKITSETAAEMGAKAHTLEAKQRRLDRIATAEELKVNLSQIALHGEHETNRMNASIHLLDRLEGKPVQRNVNLNLDALDRLSDAELERIARGGGSDIIDQESDPPVIQ